MGARALSFKGIEIPFDEVAAPAARVWSEQQNAILAWFERLGQGNLVVRARAGTGKTTVICEGVNRAPDPDTLLCAFNAPVAQEMKERVSNPAVDVLTAHALGLRACGRVWRRVAVAQKTARADELTNLVCPDAPRTIKYLIGQLHTKGREILPLTYDQDGLLLQLALEYDLTPADGWGQYDLNFIVEAAHAAMSIAATDEPTSVGIDFADMIFQPLVKNLLAREYALGVIDEAQDMTLAQLEMVQRSVLADGRIAVVGDDRQAIYSFRGADTDSLDRLKGVLAATELPLTATRRCGQVITARAQTLVPDIVAWPTNPPGAVTDVGYEHMLETASKGDFILSRLNAPLVLTTLRLLKQGKRAVMRGRDIAGGLRSIVARLQKGAMSLPVFMDALYNWERKTSTRLAVNGEAALAARCHDQASMLRYLGDDADSIDDLTNRLDWLFDDTIADTERIICMSIHKAKGLESDRVWLLQDSLYRGHGSPDEEANLEYVGITRAKHLLMIVRGGV